MEAGLWRRDSMRVAMKAILNQGLDPYILVRVSEGKVSNNHTTT